MFNFMKTGLVYADVINTVSKVYAEEIKLLNTANALTGSYKSVLKTCTEL